MSRKPPRRTRERILETALRLYNAFGEPNVTTNVIAETMGISPGNLYYHFRSRDGITDGIVEQFVREIEPLLGALHERHRDAGHAWRSLHALFELIWRYQFLYRDLNDLLWRNRTVELRFREILERKTAAARALCDGLAEAGMLSADAGERGALAINMVVVSTWWLSYETVRNARRLPEPAEQAAAVSRGARQVFMLIAPYLDAGSRAAFERMAAEPWPASPAQAVAQAT